MDVTLFRAPFSEGAPRSRALLRRAASQYTGLADSALGPIAEGAQGKPYFSYLPHLHCSVTHSGDWWLCAFGAQPLGVDLQLHRSHAEPSRLSRRFFHPREDAWLARGQYRAFFDVWCAKESWVKYTGTGFFQDPASFSVVDETGSFPRLPGMSLQLLPFLPGYSLCLCAAKISTWSLLELV